MLLDKTKMRVLLFTFLLFASAAGQAVEHAVKHAAGQFHERIELLPAPANPRAKDYRGWVSLSKAVAATDLLVDFLTEQALPFDLELENKIYRKLTALLLDPEIDLSSADIRRTRDRWLKSLQESQRALRHEINEDQSSAILAGLERLQFDFKADLNKAKKFMYVPAAYSSVQQSAAAVETAMMLDFEIRDPAARQSAHKAARNLVSRYMIAAFRALVNASLSPELLKDLESLTSPGAPKDLTDLDFRLRRLSSAVNRTTERI